MAEGSRSNQWSKSRNSRDRGMEMFKDRKRNSPRKKHSSDNARKPKDSTSKEYERKYEEKSSHHAPSHWEDRRANYKSNKKSLRSPPTSRYNNHESSDDYEFRHPATLNQQRTSYDGHHYDGFTADDVRFESYNNHESDFPPYNGFEDNLRLQIEQLTNQVTYLTEEKLKSGIPNGDRVHVHGIYSNSEVNIIFETSELQQRFLPTLEKLISELISESISLDDVQMFLSSKNNPVENDLPEGDLFSLDNSTIEPNESASVPRYETIVSEVLQDPDLMNQENINVSKMKYKRVKICYNCSEDHMIYHCPYPIDHKRVAEAKIQQKSQYLLSNSRYHVEGMKQLKDSDQMKDFKPGTISDELREALSLRPEQIPPYIYHMRVLNYPPGWLEEAEVETSGIALYDTDAQKDGNDVQHESNCRNEVKYDPDKLVDFPGFNVPLPPQFTDEADQLGLPPLQESHLRSVVEQYMPKGSVIPKRKRKLSLSGSKPAKVQRFEEDMDMDESFDNGSLEYNPPLPPEIAPPPPPDDDTLPPLPDDDPLPPLPNEDPDYTVVEEENYDSGTDTPMSDSLMETLAPVVQRFKPNTKAAETAPSLEDLEEIKKKIEMELEIPDDSSSDGLTPSVSQDNSNDVSSYCSLSSPSTSRQVSMTESCSEATSRQVSKTESCLAADSVQENSSEAEEGQISKTENCLELDLNCSEEQGPSRKLCRTDSQRSGSKLMTLGTPSLSRHSSFKMLPKYENFSKDVTDHLNFENLPNSTGTYAKMKKVIKKVKEKINSLMQ